MLWGTGITLAACVVVCGALYAGIYLMLRADADGFLRGEIQEVHNHVKEHPGSLPAIERELRQELENRPERDLISRVLDESGKVLICSDRIDPLPNPWPLPVNEATEKPAFATVDCEASEYPFRVASVWITATGGTRYIAQAAYSLKRFHKSMVVAFKICLAAVGIAAVMALIGGHYLARRSLQPVNEMTATAQRIGARQLDERVPRTGNNDELDRLAETINAMLDRIERHVRQIQQFTADASHELRNPLAALRGNAEVALTQSRSAEELRTVLEDSLTQYERLGRIAEDLLLLARIDAGEGMMRLERMRLDEAAEDVVDLYTPLAHDHKLELNFAPREQLWVEADGGRVRQLLGNLVDNAVKYTPSGQVRVSLTRENGNAQISVSDTGIGIPAEHLSRVFDRFYRVDRARSGMSAWGAGLGLSICRSIAEAHRGTIELESTPGQGTTVIVRIPLAGDFDAGAAAR